MSPKTEPKTRWSSSSLKSRVSAWRIMCWRTAAQFCERALRARGDRARVVELEKSGWVNLSMAPVAVAQGTQVGGLPAGLLLVVFVASQAQRVAFLPEQRTLCVCGVPQDLKARTLTLTLSRSTSRQGVCKPNPDPITLTLTSRSRSRYRVASTYSGAGRHSPACCPACCAPWCCWSSESTSSCAVTPGCASTSTYPYPLPRSYP